LKLTAWLVYTDGHVIDVEKNVSKEYMSILDVFSSMSAVESKSDDHEVRNRYVGRLGYFGISWHDYNFRRTRLVGLAVLNGVASSEALFNCRNHFKDQVATVVAALMVTIFQVDIPELEHV
jgi:protein EFR3